MTLGDFFRLIEAGGPKLANASKLLEVYAREQNRDMLRDFYYSDDRRVESAVLSLDEVERMTVVTFPFHLIILSEHHGYVQDPTSKITAVKAAQKFFSDDKDRGFEAKVSYFFPALYSHSQDSSDYGRICTASNASTTTRKGI